MSRLPLSTRTRKRNMALRNMLTSITVMYYYIWLLLAMAYKRRCLKIEQRIRNIEQRNVRLSQLIRDSDATCISQLRMDRRTFYTLCEMLGDIGGLKATRNMSIVEIVAQFLYTLAHHLKNRTIKEFFFRSGETVSRQFNSCLLAVLKLHHLLLKTPEPIPDDSTDGTWKYFKVIDFSSSFAFQEKKS
ncbi:hypothetical protein HU200_004549 [Digitaria exilis]|uniref:DUF8040 domain-containing protein n=1 Tax=Digitaria exilis TaxID=1010633 RepID=A0A835KTD7_9POAL|nr:hypothetical protein HU200_004549 [Digitaria exilis]